MTQKIILITYIENNPTSPDYKKNGITWSRCNYWTNYHYAQ